MDDVADWHLKHGSGLWHGHVLLDCRPPRSQVGFAVSRNRSHGIYPSLRGRPAAGLGHLGDFVELRACPVQREWTSRVLFLFSLYADPVRRYLQSFVKAN